MGSPRETDGTPASVGEAQQAGPPPQQLRLQALKVSSSSLSLDTRRPAARRGLSHAGAAELISWGRRLLVSSSQGTQGETRATFPEAPISPRRLRGASNWALEAGQGVRAARLAAPGSAPRACAQQFSEAL